MLQQGDGLWRVRERPVLYMPDGSIVGEELVDAAVMASGQGQDYSIWPRRPEAAERYCLIDLESSMSSYADISNADKIIMMLDADDLFDEHCWVEEFSGGGPQWIKKLVVEIWTEKNVITPVFIKMREIEAMLQQYPHLDSDDVSQREYDATIEHIENQGRNVVDRDRTPQDWPHQTIRWIQEVLPSLDRQQEDGSSWYTEEEIALAAIDLGFADMEEIWYLVDLQKDSRGISRDLSNDQRMLANKYRIWQRNRLAELFRSCAALNPVDRLEQFAEQRFEKYVPYTDLTNGEIRFFIQAIIDDLDGTVADNDEAQFYIDSEIQTMRFIDREMEKLNIEVEVPD